MSISNSTPRRRKPISTYFIDSHRNISSIPDELMNECPNNNDGKSPLNKILQKYLDNEPIEFYLQLLSSLDENDNGIPDWLFKFYMIHQLN